MSESESMTISEFAGLCREKCSKPAQGFDDGRGCGSISHNDEGEVFHFCGHHWILVL